ncbi:MAG: hypothetical protein AB7F96_07320 [Beijerinckiaceae bacterium]
MRSIRTLAASAVLCAAAMASATATELVYGTGSGAKSRINVDAMEPFFKETTAASKGSITWKYLPGNQIVTIRTALKGTRDGLVDVGMVVPVFVRKDLINNNIIYDTIHLGHEDPVAAAGAAYETMMLNCPDCQKEWKKNNQFVLAPYAGSSNVLVCRDPVKTVADLKGKKVRGGGATHRLVRAIGGTPISTPPQELALALERGGLDCAVMALNWMVSFGIHDLAKHVLDYPMGSSRGLALMTMRYDSWYKKLNKEQRKVLWDHAPMAAARAIMIAYLQLDENYRKTIGPSKGVKFYQAGPDIKNAIDKMMVGEEAAIATAIKKQGAKNPEKVLKAYLANLEKWKKISSGEIKGNVEAFAKALKREVYDKVDPEKI